LIYFQNRPTAHTYKLNNFIILHLILIKRLIILDRAYILVDKLISGDYINMTEAKKLSKYTPKHV